MELRVVGHASPRSDHPASHKWCGSVGHNNGDFKPTKVAKLSDDSSSPFKHSSSFGYYYDGQQEHNMLSFTSPKFENKNLQSPAFSFFSKSSGYSFSNGSVNFVNGVRGPFTASQWLELEQQALIYKHIIANEPVPYNLLMPIRRAFQSAGFCNFLGGLLRSNTIGYGWSPFHLGVSNTTDPEPGRCRRTDGKKWRCSKEALPDHKYCERHMNRGRHRSRKPVEGHSANSVPGASTNNITSTMANCSEDGLSNKFARNVEQNKDLLNYGHSFHLPSTLLKRHIENKDDNNQSQQDAARLDFLSHNIGLNTSGNALSFSISAADDFSSRTSGAILSTTTTPKGSSTLGAYGHSHNFNTPRLEPLHSSRSFMEDRSSVLWPKMHTQTEKSQLSVSIPPSDLMSSTSSPTREEETISPLRLSRELGLLQTGLGVGLNSWENSSMGGPLGEVLKTTSTSNNSSGSLQLASSPTGVLHRTALGYFSNSSAGSSPRAEYRKINDSIGFTLGSSSFMPL